MNQGIGRWLQSEDTPRDIYELLGKPRFDPDTAQLLSAVRSANRELWPYQNHHQPKVAQRALVLMSELGRAADILGHAAKREAYDQTLGRALGEEFTEKDSAFDQTERIARLRHWLVEEKNVHPDRLGATMSAILSPSLEVAPIEQDVLAEREVVPQGRRFHTVASFVLLAGALSVALVGGLVAFRSRGREATGRVLPSHTQEEKAKLYAAGLWSTALMALQNKQIADAKRLLSEYQAHARATQSELARSLLEDIDLATSDDRAIELLKTYSDAFLVAFQASGSVPALDQVTNVSLRAVYTDTLRRHLRDELARRAEASKQTTAVAAVPETSPDSSRERFVGHTAEVLCVAFSADGRRALSGSQDQTLRLWDTATGRELMRFKGHTGAVRGASLSADGRRALSGSEDQTVRLWDTETGQELKEFAGHEARVMCVALAAGGGRAVSGGNDETVRLWNTESGQELMRFMGHSGSVRSVAISADGRRILSGGRDKTVRLWDAETGQELKRFDGHIDVVSSVSLSADGHRVLSGSDDGTVRLWDAITGAQVSHYVIQGVPITCVALSADGLHMLAGDLNGMVWLWGVSAKEQMQKFEGHTGAVYGVALTPDGRRALSASHDQTVRQWNATSAPTFGPSASQTASIGNPDAIVGEINQFAQLLDGSSSVSLAGDGRLALIVPYSMVVFGIWDVDSGTELRVFKGHSRSIRCATVSANGSRVLSAGSDMTVRVWDVATGQELRRLIGHAGPVNSVVLSPDGLRALTGCKDRTVRLWDIETGVELKRFRGHSEEVTSVALSADGRLALSGSNDTTVRLWNVETGEELKRLGGHTNWVTSVALSADGRRAASGGWDTTVRLWDTETGAELHLFKEHTDVVTSVALSPDGGRILSGSSDKILSLWDLEASGAWFRFEGHTNAVRGVALSADGRRAVSVGNDDRARVWGLPKPRKR